MNGVLGDLVSEATSLLDRRFVLNAFLPSLLLTGLLTAVIAGNRLGAAQAPAVWDRQPTTVKVLLVVAFFALVLLVAGILSSQLPALLRWYEGYWRSRLGRSAARLGRRWHRARYRQLVGSSADDPAAYETLYLRYPPPGHQGQVMPTRLGNILKNAELYPRVRYGLDAVLVWPRLYPILPDRFAAALSAAKANLDFLLAFSAVAAGFAVLAGGYLVVVGAPWWLFLACFWGGALVAWAAYHGVVGAALVYSQQIKTAFDLYRGDLLEKLGIPAPASFDDERARWRQLAGHWYRGIPAIAEETPLPATDDNPGTGRALLPLSDWLAVGVTLAGLAALARLLGP